MHLKAQMHCCGHALSVGWSSLTFHIFNFSSETSEQNSTKLDRKQDLNTELQITFWVKGYLPPDFELNADF